jgi:hypothetical protein
MSTDGEILEEQWIHGLCFGRIGTKIVGLVPIVDVDYYATELSSIATISI